MNKPQTERIGDYVYWHWRRNPIDPTAWQVTIDGLCTPKGRATLMVKPNLDAPGLWESWVYIPGVDGGSHGDRWISRHAAMEGLRRSTKRDGIRHTWYYGAIRIDWQWEGAFLVSQDTRLQYKVFTHFNGSKWAAVALYDNGASECVASNQDNALAAIEACERHLSQFVIATAG